MSQASLPLGARLQTHATTNKRTEPPSQNENAGARNRLAAASPPQTLASLGSPSFHPFHASHCAMNRMTGSQSKISGSVPLTTALMKLVAAGKLSCLSEETVVPFLQQHLEIRVLGSNDTSIALESVDGLHISITSAQVKVPETETSFPEWGDVITQWEAWKG